jgi:hypothetical protein
LYNRGIKTHQQFKRNLIVWVYSNICRYGDVKMNTPSEPFKAVFDQLRSILTPYEKDLVVKSGLEGEYYLETRHLMKNKQLLFFGSVKAQKNYVSFYLMPVYVFPELLDSASPELRKRMQGKSCFNFKTPDPALFAELASLTERGFARYQQAGLLE